MNRCSYCGSTDIIYDFSRGYTVCTNCGSVNDIIYNSDSELYSRIGYSEEPGARHRNPHSNKHWHQEEASKLDGVGRAYKIYRGLVGKKRLKKGVFVSSEALQDLVAGRKPARIFDHVNNKVVIELLERSPILKKVIDIMKEYPSIYSRTTRGKAAAAYIAAKMAIRDPVSLSSVSRFFNLSMVHLRRIKRSLESSEDLLNKISYIEDLSREIAEADMFIKKHLGS
ncbi:MAG TPA: TFIIB-type zinc ribbon-containing protein [Sulfolobales archaeon]|nr:TFIIB-type zinc ribbon-containing protein [Sulfolobales archaeon]